MKSTQQTQSSKPTQSSQPDYKLDEFNTDTELPDPLSALQEGDESKQAEGSSKQFTTKNPTLIPQKKHQRYISTLLSTMY